MAILKRLFLRCLTTLTCANGSGWQQVKGISEKILGRSVFYKTQFMAIAFDDLQIAESK